MTIQDVSQFIADWATLAAAVATFLTLLEMNKQRKHSYKPDIVPVEKIVTAEMTSEFNGKWKERLLDGLKRTPNPNNESDICVTLFNLGNGAAKNIEFKWDFAFSSFIQSMNRLNEQHNTGLKAYKSKHGIQIDNTKNGNKIGFSNLHLTMNIHKDYLLPASMEHQGLRIQMPHAYIGLFSSHVYAMSKNSLESFDAIKIPDIRLDIEYTDIADNKYFTSFTFNIDFMSLGRKDGDVNFDIFLRYKLLKQA